ncbi:hypothetical protein C7B65_17840 [Phormidesmis priestleyi ULC007]|uniref:Uncharacterized protein n=1 Tax=Phormidesmis priestleyi ULC007 TaxID=1920490 RepID=A0A2T1DBA2_9CYAN|nr:hypothetical protein C7B65_17840 [Phormidesmis priestleyi ULC007]PZO48707.1 MAG: hypothetical protein DCF14_16380 [Phormidesmis priestleyi]
MFWLLATLFELLCIRYLSKFADGVFFAVYVANMAKKFIEAFKAFVNGQKYKFSASNLINALNI